MAATSPTRQHRPHNLIQSCISNAWLQGNLPRRFYFVITAVQSDDISKSSDFIFSLRGRFSDFILSSWKVKVIDFIVKLER